MSYYVTWIWLGDAKLSLSVSLATLCTIATAPIIALVVTQAFQSFHEDPAA